MPTKVKMLVLAVLHPKQTPRPAALALAGCGESGMEAAGFQQRLQPALPLVLRNGSG